MAWVFSHIPARSKGISMGWPQAKVIALWAMFTARSPIRSRSLLIFKAATMNRRSAATGW